MGGIGSTRWVAHRRAPTVERCMRLRVYDVIDELRHDPAAVSGYAGGLVQTGAGFYTQLVPYVLPWSLEEGPDGFRILCVHDEARGTEGGDGGRAGGPIERIALERAETGCTMRLWLLCPDCGARARILYRPLARAGLRFACRTCHGLTYRSRQAHDKFLDPYLRMHPLRRASRTASPIPTTSCACSPPPGAAGRTRTPTTSGGGSARPRAGRSRSRPPCSPASRGVTTRGEARSCR